MHMCNTYVLRKIFGVRLFKLDVPGVQKKRLLLFSVTNDEIFHEK